MNSDICSEFWWEPLISFHFTLSIKEAFWPPTQPCQYFVFSVMYKSDREVGHTFIPSKKSKHKLNGNILWPKESGSESHLAFIES